MIVDVEIYVDDPSIVLDPIVAANFNASLDKKNYLVQVICTKEDRVRLQTLIWERDLPAGIKKGKK